MKRLHTSSLVEDDRKTYKESIELTNHLRDWAQEQVGNVLVWEYMLFVRSSKQRLTSGDGAIEA